MVRLIKPDRSAVRNYTSRREQWRLMLLILPLGLVIIFMARLREPETAKHINSLFAPTDEAGQSNIAQATPGDAPRKIPPVADVASAASTGLFPGVRAEPLGTIKDNTYFRNDETGAWFHLFGILQRTTPEQVEAAHSVDADYVQLVDQPDFYRGKLVTVYGWVRQVTKQTPAANDLGIKSYYRVVVQPTDGSNWPIFVYALELPPGLSEGNELSGSVKVTGLFFKNLSYRWQDGLGTAPVIATKSIEYYGTAPGEPGGIGIHEPAAPDAWSDAKTKTAVANNEPTDKSPTTPTAFRDILGLAGWDVARLAKFDDGKPFSEEQRLLALELLRRVRSFDSASLEDWVHEGLAPYYALTKPIDYRGQLVRLAGRVTKVTKHTPAAKDVERLEMPEYFECELIPDGKGWKSMIVLTTRVPHAWLRIDKLNEPATAIALYLKRLSNDDPPSAIWLAKEIAWYPTTASELHVSFGASVLGTLGMDVGLLDKVESRGRIRSEEREAFYQMLDAVNRIGAHQLVRFAEGNLPVIRDAWKRELQSAKDEPRRAFAHDVAQRAAQGRYSVAPLFNDPQNQIGRLFVFDGTARRAVRVEVGSRPDGGGPSDVARRFGIDHYYELEVFTDDSQNYPLVFCMRELPPGFPTGGSIHVPVRVAGFFFKDWLYRTRGTEQVESAADRAQYAPFLIGRAPLVMTIEQGAADVGRLVAGGLFLVGLVGIWAAAAWYARGDRRFRERRKATNYSLPPDQSLNELNLPTAEQPISISGPAEFNIRDPS